MSASVRNTRLILLAALLSTCSDSMETSDDRVQKIYASAGESVFLPCQINVTNGDIPTVEWYTGGLVQKIYTFVYREDGEVTGMKNKDFQNRTSLFINEVDKGNILLRISNVRLSDAGKHECSIILDRKPKVITTLELIVSKDTKSCKVWSFVAGAVVVFSTDVVVVVAVGAFAAGIGVRFPFVFLRNKVRSCCAGRNIPPESNQPSVQSPDNPDASSYLMENQTDSPTIISELLSKIEELELQLQEKERLNSQLAEELKLDRRRALSTFDRALPSQPSPEISNVINLHQFPNGSDPKPGASSNSNPSNSGSLPQEKETKPGVSPSLSPYHGPVSSDPSQNSNSENEPIRLSESWSLPRLHRNGAKLQSRKSFSAGTRSHFSDKEDLPEDSEHLLPS